jgi:hypothetical protein
MQRRPFQMNNRHVFRDLMTRYPANDREARRQLLFLIAALAALIFVMMSALFA